MLGVSGLRGIVGESLTPEVAVRYAAAFGAWLLENRVEHDVFVGWDGRHGGDSIHSLVMTALQYAGLGVYDAGIATTPTLGVVADSYGGHAVQITASHNPFPWNGIKLLIRDDESTLESAQSACAPSAKIAREIIERYESGTYEFSWYEGARLMLEKGLVPHILHGGKVDQALGESETSKDHPYFKIRDERFTCVLDSVNASGGPAAEELMGNLNCRYIQLHGDDSGIFPHTPEPTAENLSGEGGLCDAVPGLKADIGFAQDPDGDRLAIVDEQGRYIGEEYTLVLAAMSILEARKSRGREHAGGDEEDGALTPALSHGAREREEEKTPHPGPLPEGEREEETVICVNLSTSRMIDDVAAKYGARVVRTAVGEANVVEAMKKLKREGVNVILGGEGNGGVIWPEVTYVRDSLGAMALTLSLMARTGKTVSELVADVPSYAIVKRKQPLAKKEDAKPTVEKLAEHYASKGDGVHVDTQDGVRIDFEADRAWVHVRASNTEPILRLIGEAPTREKVEAVLDEVQRLVDGG